MRSVPLFDLVPFFDLSPEGTEGDIVNSATQPPDKCQMLLGLARRRATVTLDGAALFVIDANCHGPLSRDGFAAPSHLAQYGIVKAFQAKRAVYLCLPIPPTL